MKTLVAITLLLFVAIQVEGRALRESRGLKIYDLVRGGGYNPRTTPAPAPKPKKPLSDAFDLEDALSPASTGNKAADQTSNAEALAEIKKKLDALFEIENLQMKMLQRMNRCG